VVGGGGGVGVGGFVGRRVRRLVVVRSDGRCSAPASLPQ